MMRTVAVLTDIPSPYQVEFFNALAAEGGLRPQVIYTRRRCSSRQWDVPTPDHKHVFRDEGKQAIAVARDWIARSDLVVVSYYSDKVARRLIRMRAAAGRPWCLWGERPGGRWGLMGRFRRRLHLSDLARSRAPIWGIGSWAINGWRCEFGSHRRYENIPYFSDLERFVPNRAVPRQSFRTILFSGSLIPRKGIDLAAEAFVRLASDFPDARFHILGSGPLEVSLRQRLSHLQERVSFLGFQPWSELPAVYQTADILCAPSRYDGWGLIVPEGLAAGLPVIATDRMGAALDLIRSGENGWITTAGDVYCLEETMRAALSLTDDQLASISRKAMETAESHSLSQGVNRFRRAVTSALDHAHAI